MAYAGNSRSATQVLQMLLMLGFAAMGEALRIQASVSSTPYASASSTNTATHTPQASASPTSSVKPDPSGTARPSPLPPVPTPEGGANFSTAISAGIAIAAVLAVAVLVKMYCPQAPARALRAARDFVAQVPAAGGERQRLLPVPGAGAHHTAHSGLRPSPTGEAKTGAPGPAPAPGSH